MSTLFDLDTIPEVQPERYAIAFYDDFDNIAEYYCKWLSNRPRMYKTFASASAVLVELQEEMHPDFADYCKVVPYPEAWR